MKVKCKAGVPIKRKDGSWEVVIKDTERDIPDKGRDHWMCNLCSRGDYPNCKRDCTKYLPADEQRRINKAKRLAQKNTAN